MRKTAAKQSAPPVRRSPMEHPRHQYPEATAALQEIAQSCGLVETIKWGKPCYALGKKNIVLIQRFKDYIALLFFKGALLDDREGLLYRIGEHTQTPRQLRFRSLDDVVRLRATIKAYIEQAIEIEESGKRVERSNTAELEIPAELQAKLDSNPALKKAFNSLTPGRRKGYIYRIADAKKTATRTSRVEQYTSKILAGKGLHD
jgi:uncharacterized protein YdeI (YjbR/CyaY-like superfamily)